MGVRIAWWKHDLKTAAPVLGGEHSPHFRWQVLLKAHHAPALRTGAVGPDPCSMFPLQAQHDHAVGVGGGERSHGESGGRQRGDRGTSNTISANNRQHVQTKRAWAASAPHLEPGPEVDIRYTRAQPAIRFVEPPASSARGSGAHYYWQVQEGTSRNAAGLLGRSRVSRWHHTAAVEQRHG